MMKRIVQFLLIILCFGPLAVQAQITVNPNQTANDLAQMLAGQGVTISNASFNSCEPNANGKFFVTVSTLGLDSGIILTSGSAVAAVGPSAVPANVNTNNYYDADLDLINNNSIEDACVLEFDFVPVGDTIKFNYVFGSAEYQSFTCSSFEDAFGFFISGPGINGPFSNNAVNIALVPGTNCPITINTINASTQNPCGSVTAPCAPPNNALFVNNLPIGNNNTGVAYNGFTQVLTAIQAVVPCSTYHLKLAVSDASDQTLDTGTFIEAGSLTSNALTVFPFATLSAPVPYIVEGCNPALIRIERPIATANPLLVEYDVAGVAINGTDVNFLSGQATIPANDSVVDIIIFAINDNITEGLENLKIYIKGYCGANGYIDSTEIFISDSLIVDILNSDTSICREDSIQLNVLSDPNFVFSWSPNVDIYTANIQNPIVNPQVNTSYTISVTLPNSGCAPSTDVINVDVNVPPNVNIGSDIVACQNAVINFNPIITPNQVYTYIWSPPTFLNASNIANPTATLSTMGTFTYSLMVEPTAVGCNGYDTIVVRVIPNDFVITTSDTAICIGDSVQIQAIGDTTYWQYAWQPNNGSVSNPYMINPLITPTTIDSNVYTVIGYFSGPGCSQQTKYIGIDTEPIPDVNVGADRAMCIYQSMILKPQITPAYNQYFYEWSPGADIDSPNNEIVVYSGTMNNQDIILTVATSAGCIGSDTVNITVHPTDFTVHQFTDTAICPGNTVALNVSGAVTYTWVPSFEVSDSSLSSPLISPTTTTQYTLYATDQYGCYDTTPVLITVMPQAILDLGPDRVAYPNESIQFDANGNCSFFKWFPVTYLNYADMGAPLCTPEVSTQYIVEGKTEFGCKVYDTVQVIVNDESYIDIPNAFSPGDLTSSNDLLKLIVRGQTNLKAFKIYNRWGELVFSTTNINEGWDGKYKGKIQPMGVYLYVVEAISHQGKKINKQGNITLIR